MIRGVAGPAQRLSLTDSSIHRLTNLEGRDELGEGDEEEVQIHEGLELLVEDQRHEADHRVLLVADEVRWKAVFQLHCEGDD